MTGLPRIFPGDTLPTTGGWSLTLENRGRKRAILFLPCGHSWTFGTAHEINEVGEIIPSVVCLREKCNFHDHVQLRSWTP